MAESGRRQTHQDWALLLCRMGRFEGQEKEERGRGGTRLETGELSRELLMSPVITAQKQIALPL